MEYLSATLPIILYIVAIILIIVLILTPTKFEISLLDLLVLNPFKIKKILTSRFLSLTSLNLDISVLSQ